MRLHLAERYAGMAKNESEPSPVMPFALARVSLLPGPDDPAIVGGAYQSTFGKFRRFLRIRGVEASTPMFYHDDDTESGGYAGEFILPLGQAIRAPLATVLSAWLEARPERAVRLSVGEEEAEARSTEEAERFLWRAQHVRAKPSFDHNFERASVSVESAGPDRP